MKTRVPGALALLAVLAFAAPARAGQALPAAQDPAARAADELAEAKRLFDALDYEHAVPALDRSIAMLAPLVSNQTAVEPSLASAYEMRARARFGLGDRDGTVEDLKALLDLDPGFAFGSQVSPRIVSVLDEVRKTAIGFLQITVDPADAVVELNGKPYTPSPSPVPVRAAQYTVKAARIGYAPVEDTLAVSAGETRQLGLTLERAAAVVYLVTSPPDVEILVDGSSRGTTRGGPLPASYADVPGQLGVAPDAVSKPLVLTDLSVGAHVLRFRRACHAAEERRLVIDGLSDFRVEPVKLARAVASVAIETAPAGARVYVDGEPRGATPLTLDDLCEGTRVIEARGPSGRLVRRLELKRGDEVSVSGALKPAFALVPAGLTGSTNAAALGASVEQALAASQQVTVFQPAGPAAADALTAANAPAEWLAFDAGRRPLGGAVTVSAAVRRDLSTRLARALDVQGIAAVTQPSASAPDVVVALLAAGADAPDVVSLVPERVDSITRAIARFDLVPPVFRPAVGLLAIEITGGDGVVIARIEPGSAAEKAGLVPGDLIVAVEGQAANAPGAFARALETRRAGQTLGLEVRQRSGVTRSVTLPVVSTPRIISASDQTLLFNPLSVALRSRLAAAESAEQPYLRIDLGIALMRLGDYEGAKDQFEAVELPPGPGIALGTRDYLLGLAFEGLGDAASAQKAWTAAAASEASLTEDGPPVGPLARIKLGQPGQPPLPGSVR